MAAKNRQPRRSFRSEALENRTLFASIAGSVFLDYNGNGKLDAGEGGPGAGSQKIFIDSNNDGVADNGEPTTSVDPFGNFFFNVPAAGTYRVTLQQDSGFIRTTPAVDFSSVKVTSASQNVTGVNFGIVGGASVFGSIYNDANGNGKQDSTDSALTGANAYLDLNNNGSIDSSTATTASASNLKLNTTNLPAVASDLTVSGASNVVTDVNVTLNITTSNANDPQVYLEDPQGVRVLLVWPVDTANQDTKSNFTNTTFDDQAATPISAGNAPFTGTFRTSGLALGDGLSDFNGVSANGRWRLIVQNTGLGTNMILNSWSLQITSGDPKATTGYSGAYTIPTYPGTYTVRAAEANFTTTQPNSAAGGKVVTTLKYTDNHEADFGLHETTTRNKTVTFSPASALANGTTDSPFGVVSADFNGDGKPDIAAANNGSNNVGIYINKGNGQFNAPAFLPAGDAPRGIAFGDFNGDGKIDLVVANHDTNNVSVYLGNGNGTFKSQVTYPAIASAWSLAVGDINGDGKPDILVGSNAANYVQVLINNGNGTFKTGSKITVGAYPQAIVLADFNGDKKLDIATANFDDNQIAISLGNGTGAFGSVSKINVGTNPDGIAAGDLNGDGKTDIVVADYGSGTIDVLTGKGNGTFNGRVSYDAGSFPAAASVADINKDGKADLVIANRGDGTSTAGSVMVFLGNGDGTLNPPFNYAAENSPVSSAVADLNGDGYLDIINGNFNSDNVSVLLNTTKPPAQTLTKRSGTVIGTSGSYNNTGNTIAKAVDGNLATYFDGPSANGNWVGLDLGSAQTISTISFAPRTGWASRMVGGQLQISTTANFSSGVTTVATITSAPPQGSLTTITLSSPVTARYIRYLSPTGSYGDIAELAFFG